MEMKKYKLSEIAEITSSKRIFEKEYVEDGIPFIRGQEITDGSITNSSSKFLCYISPERYEELKKTYGVPQKNDILITAVGTIGNTYLVEDNKKFYFKDGNIIWFKNISSEVYPEYLQFFMKSSFFNKQIEYSLIGAVQKALTIVMLSKIEIPLPTFQTQQKIAAVLSALDDKIALNRRMNAKLEQMAKRLYDHWFVQFDFPVSCHSELVSESHSEEMLNQVQHDERIKPYKSSGGKMVWNETLKREIPDGWEVGNLYDIAEYVNGLACQNYRPKESEKSLPVIKIREMNEGITADTEKVSASIPGKYRIYAGDILFSWSASLEIKIWTGETGGLNQHIFKVIPKGYFSKGYVYQQLSAYLVNFQKMAESRKTTMGHITSDHIKQSRILIPPKEIISAFTKKTLSIFNYQLSIEKETTKLTSLRDRLLPLLMNGQVQIQ